MHSHESDGFSEQHLPPDRSRGFLRRFLFTSDHRMIGLQYLWLALLSVVLGMGLSFLMRLHLLWPDAGLRFLGDFGRAPERYAALTLLHGSLMVFFVLTAAPQAGFGNYLLPLQIGAWETAFPNLNAVTVWAAGLSLAGMVAAFLAAPGAGVRVWVGSVAVFCLASLLVAINLSVTVIDLRAMGMTLPRLPVTVWAWFINALLSLLIFSILLAACIYLLADRVLGTHFFAIPTLLSTASPNSQAVVLPALWQRLFWF